MTSSVEDRSFGKRRAIVEAATSLFLGRGYDGTSMDDVAGFANVSKPTVYNHFDDKEQLFAEVVQATADRIDGLVRLVGDTLSRADDVEKALTELARQFIGAIMQPQTLRLRRLVIANADRFPDVGRRWYKQGFERVLMTLADIALGYAMATTEDPPLGLITSHLSADIAGSGHDRFLVKRFGVEQQAVHVENDGNGAARELH